MQQEKNKMQDFWDRVGSMMVKYDNDLCSHNGIAKGYLEIKSDGIIYRSIPPDEYGVIVWVSWKPFRVIYHFSTLSDPNGTIKFVKNGDAD